MSGQQIGTVVGGAIGFYFGGPQGAQFGMAIGGMIGGAVDPDVIKAPSIGDAQQQTSNAGVPRPVVFGHPAPFSGNIIDGEAKARKIKVKTQQGKGGPIVVSERFLLTTAVRICEGPIAGVVRIWRNGEVVYDRRTIAQLPSYDDATSDDVFKWFAQTKAKSNSFQNKVRIYLGTEDQLPDPALEIIHGVGNTPYYRGTAYMVITDDDVTDTRGAAAQYQFEVLAADAGTDAPTPDLTPNATGAAPYTHAAGTAGGLQQASATRTVTGPLIRMIADWGHATPGYDAPSRVQVKIAGQIVFDGGWLGDVSHQTTLDSILTTAGRADLRGAINPTTAGVVRDIVTAPGSVTYEVTVYLAGPPGGAATGTQQGLFPDPAFLPASYSVIPETPDVLLGSDGELYYTAWYTGGRMSDLLPGSIQLSSVVESIAARCRVPASRLDVSVLTDSIPGLLIAQQASGADCIRPTQQMFFYDMPEVDGEIVAVRRGGVAAATLTDDDLLETGESEEITRPQQVEFPAKVSVVTQDPAAEYSPIPQTSIRTSPNVTATNEVTITSPIPFGATEAKRRADIIHKIMFCVAEGKREFALPDEFSRLVPSDCVQHNGKRWLIEQKDSEEGQHIFKCAYDRASSYQSIATGVDPRPPTLPSTGLRGPTTLAVMNLPSLRAQDNVPGVYIAATGELDGWDGCVVEMSSDDGQTYAQVAIIESAAPMGRLTDAITDSSEPIPVQLIDGELVDVTAAQIANRSNAFALLGPGDVSEIGQFQTATEIDDDEYDLTLVSRGVLLTEAASHAAGERFVMLDNSVFVPIDIGLSGRLLRFRGVTNGTAPEKNAVVSFLYAPIAPVNTIPFDYITTTGEPYVTAADELYFGV